ncbi:MAG: hypothetical protein AABW93_01395 [Nanoarchaeota archaeon]
MSEDSDDRTGTVRFILCAYSLSAGSEDLHYYCCSQPDVIKSGKYPLLTIQSRKWNESESKYDDRHIEAVRLGGVLLGDEELLEFSWARQKKKGEGVERILNPCIDCKFWKIRKEDLSKKLPEPE